MSNHLLGSPASSNTSDDRMEIKQRNISVLGYRGVGKSATVIQYVDGHFVDSYLPTIENTFYKRVMFRSEDIDIAIRDTTGQDEVTVFHPRNCLGVHGYILVFSVTSKYSFEIVKFINDKLLCNLMGTNSVARVLIGNKCDLEHERQISTQEGQALADEWGCAYVECSAKHGENIYVAFETLLQEIQKDEGDLVPSTSNCKSCVSCSFCCDRPMLKNERQQRVAVRVFKCINVLTLLAGVFFLGLGIQIATDKNNAHSGWFLYGLLVIGTFALVISAVGFYGAHRFNKELIRLYGFSFCLILLSQVVLSGLAFTPNMPLPTAWPEQPCPMVISTVIGVLELVGIIVSVLLQCGIENVDDAVYHLHDSSADVPPSGNAYPPNSQGGYRWDT